MDSGPRAAAGLRMALARCVPGRRSAMSAADARQPIIDLPDGPAGRPRSPSRLWWENQHRRGVWKRRLSSDDERLRYEALGVAIRGAGTAGSLLDLGCAHGLLIDYLDADDRARYTGVDISPSAIATGRQNHQGSGARFVSADLRYWTPPAMVDTIVFNEILYYFARPPALIRRYSSWLSPGGRVFVSMYHGSYLRAPFSRLRIDRIWRLLARDFDLLDAASVLDTNGAPTFRIARLGCRDGDSDAGR